MKKEIAVFTISDKVGEFYKEQLYWLFEDLIEVSTFSIEKENLDHIVQADLYLVAATSSDSFEYAMSFIPKGSKMVVSHITFRRESLDILSKFPKGTKALLVNLSANMTIETISDLNRFGITNLEFFPVYPGLKTIPDIDLAITPGEGRYVPEGINQVIDIGHRVFTANTIMEIALKLDFTSFIESERCKEYIRSLAEMDYSTNALASRSYTLENKFEILLEAVDEGIVGIDAKNIIFAFNRLAGSILMMDRSKVIGHEAFQALPFLSNIMSKEKYTESETNLVKIKGIYINATIAPIIRDSRYIGTFLLIQRFNDEENKQHRLRAQMLGKRDRSKYTFRDITGESPNIQRAKNIAQKMAKTDASILLTGESGTGKELFAHSIHNSSERRNMPFVAINCAALPDSLLESELFGYGDGAFTGAKKGGKIGLFEYAHKGTLFLDEIEGMSPNLQIKLLRILQEKEVMRIGENKIIHIDVRIIAATNENIRNMVEKSSFRKDLYYRLNTLPIDIPPLRERGNDMFLIMEDMKRECGVDFQLTEEARNAFLRYRWDGNVRELHNIVEYLKYMDLKVIRFEDLPDVLKETAPWRKLSINSTFAEQREKRENSKWQIVLRILLEAGEKGIGMGRKMISQETKQKGVPLSEQEVRTVMKALEANRWIVICRGRKGTRITEAGKAHLKNG